MPYHLKAIFKTDTSPMTDEQLWEHYEQCLTKHDWTYMMSDDGGVYKAGRDETQHILGVKNKLEIIDMGRADRLYWKYSFWYNDDGSRKNF